MMEKTRWQTVVVAAAVLALSLGMPMTARAHSPRVPAVLTAAWWQWALSIPDVPPAVGSKASIHPLVGDDHSFGADDAFEFCGVGQHGPVWFLGGDFAGTGVPFTRTCKIPAGKALLLAVINAECSTAEGDANVHDAVAVKAQRLAECARDLIAPVIVAEATLNGKALEVQKVSTTRPFSIFLPPSNVLGREPEVNPSLSQASGFWVLLRELGVGTHTVHFRGGIPGEFEIEGTYKIEIVPQTEQ